MPKRFYQLGDYDNTIERKILENQTQYPTSAALLAVSGSATVVRYAADGDDDNTLWRKLLENMARSLP